MSLKHGILGFLNYGDMTGYDLDKAFKESLDFFWHAQTSQVYRELTGLEKQGFVNSKIIIQTDKPNKKEYSITEVGKTEFLKWLSEDAFKESMGMKNIFLVKLFFSGEKPVSENIEVLKRFKDDCEKFLDAMRNVNQSIDYYKNLIDDNKKAVYWGLTANFGYCYVAMCIKWADDTINILGGLKE